MYDEKQDTIEDESELPPPMQIVTTAATFTNVSFFSNKLICCTTDSITGNVIGVFKNLMLGLDVCIEFCVFWKNFMLDSQYCIKTFKQYWYYVKYFSF